MKTSLLKTPVSFGTNILRPGQLQNRPVGDILQGIQGGEWRTNIEHIRNLQEAEQERAKTALPFFTASGVFTYKSNDRLVQYSGIVVIDLDGLTLSRINKAVQRAVVDPHCFAAFRSPRGAGLKLLFRVPGQFGVVHSQIFPQVVAHVRKLYREEPDSKPDVSRACFVSWDSGAWIFGHAKELPIAEPSRSDTTASRSPIPVPRTSVPDFQKIIGKARAGDWMFQRMGFECGPKKPKPNDLHYTNGVLLHLARRVATEIWKQKSLNEKKGLRWLAVAFRGWSGKSRWNRVRLHPQVYWKELMKMFRRQMASGHPEKNATKWTRWREHPDFPQARTSRDKILFSIQKHCAEHATNRFFLSQRDAGCVAGVSHVRAGQLLQKLRKEGRIDYDPAFLKNRYGKRDAQRWVLVEV